MRRFSKLVILMSLFSAMLLTIPSSQAAEILGEVHGNVNIDSGYVPTDPMHAPVATHYNFVGVEIVGLLRDAAGNVFEGQISTSGVEGGSGGESASGGSGRVNNAPYACPIVGNPGRICDPRASLHGVAANGTVIDGKFFGTYTRTGTYVEVHLDVQFWINGAAHSNCIPSPCGQSVVVRAQFTPTTLNGDASGAIGAVFDGSFSHV